MGDALLGDAALRDVEPRAEGRGQAPVVVVEQGVAPLDDPHPAVARQHAALAVLARPALAGHHLVEDRALLDALVG
jgi:hypothetical protein